MQIDRRKIESSLLKKGFVKEEAADHKYFYHEYNGKRTGISTHTSHGSGYKTYGDNLISMIKRQLRLDTNNQIRDFLLCPMTSAEYIQILTEKNIW